MGRSDSPDVVAALAAAWRGAGRVVVLSGAGISTASGIPDFRSPGGRWEHYQPVPIQDFMASARAREEYWRYKGETWQVIQQARPNPAHQALAELANAGHIDLLVTQNVDGLHERSGFPPDRQICIHGSDARIQCMACGARSDRVEAQRLWEGGAAVPSCACGGALKPATISFGQRLVEADLDRSFRAAAACDLMVAVGSSLVVSPINHMVPLALDGGASVAILTASETPFDEVARYRSVEALETVVPELARRILVADA